MARRLRDWLALSFALLACGCSSVTYHRDADGSASVRRWDLGRDVQGERLEVASAGFSYSVDAQNESESFQRLVAAAERWLMLLSMERTVRNRDSIGGETDKARIGADAKTQQINTLDAGRTTRALAGEETKRILAP